MNLFFLLFPALMIWASCSVGPPYVQPGVDLPAEWKNSFCQSCESIACPDFWWQVFDDAKLDELEQLALENNRDLFIAFERIQASRALMGIAAADFYPQLTLNPLYTSTGELIKNYVNSAALPKTGPLMPFRAHELLYFLPLNLSYELDLWGKIRENYKAAKYEWLAQEKDYQA